MLAAISRLIYKVIGWKCITSNYPYHIKKKILIAAPHTSNWDFPIGILARTILKDKIKYIGKASLFKPPLGWIMYPLGGIPVKRTKTTNFVRAIVNEYEEREELTIVIAPEGQRKKTNHFKTGFYFIAKNAGVAIIPTIFDWKNKEVRFLDPVYPGEDTKKEIAEIEDMFRGVIGKVPEDSF